jgi:CheY-like chemotaxis protein
MAAMSPRTPELPGPSGPRAVLLVEDNAINQKVMTLMLAKLGMHPLVVPSGNAALEAVRGHAFDLIFMDLHMPGMHGVEASRRIRELLGESAPPIVALTADAVLGNEKAVLKEGLSGFLTKPVSPGILRSCIEKHTGPLPD